MVHAIIIAVLIIAGLSCQFIFKIKDSAVEQVIENVLDHELDLPNGTIDLTPDDKDN